MLLMCIPIPYVPILELFKYVNILLKMLLMYIYPILDFVHRALDFSNISDVLWYAKKIKSKWL